MSSAIHKGGFNGPLFYVTNNPYKAEEVRPLAAEHNVPLEVASIDVRELQTLDRALLIRDKVLKAFEKLRYPVFVEHASLRMSCLGGMPGALTQLFWDTLQGRLCDLVAALGDARATAVSTIALCDGWQVYEFEETQDGSIVNRPRGMRAFQWDTIFMPDGQSMTYGEMSVDAKNKISPRSKAITRLFGALPGTALNRAKSISPWSV